MTSYLVDTSVLSLMAPGRAGVSEAVADWLRQHSDQLFVCTITVAEIQQGICKLKRAGAEERAQSLTAWLHQLIEAEPARIVGFNAEIALIAGEISDAAVAKGRHPGFADVAIAAVAQSRDMILLTANVRHFEPLGIACLDPLEIENSEDVQG